MIRDEIYYYKPANAGIEARCRLRVYKHNLSAY